MGLMVGYDLMTVDLGSYVITHTTHPVWGKLPAILEAFDKYPDAEWIWWLDMDAIIMTPEVDLQRHLLNPEILQQKLINGQPILLTDEVGRPIVSGHYTTVHLSLVVFILTIGSFSSRPPI